MLENLSKKIIGKISNNCLTDFFGMNVCKTVNMC